MPENNHRARRASGLLAGLLAASALAAWGCSQPSEEDDAAPSTPVDTSPGSKGWPDGQRQVRAQDPACEAAGIRLRRTRSWLGLGLQVTLELRGPQGAPLGQDAGPELSLRAGATGPQVPFSLQKVAETGGGLTGIALIATEDAQAHAAAVTAAKAFVSGLPADERLALWRVTGADVELLAEMSDRHAHVLARLDALPPKPSSEADLAALANLRALLASLEGPWGRLSRALVVVGSAPRPPSPPIHGAVATLHLSAARATADAAGDEDGWLPPSTPAQAGARLAAHLSAARAATWRLGSCDPMSLKGPLVLERAGGRCTVLAEGTGAPAPIGMAVGVSPDVACNAQDAAADAHPYGDEVTISFSAEERAVWQQRYGNKRKDDFTGKVRLGPLPPQEAVMHLRGSTSLHCDRVSISVDLKGSEHRRLMPGRGGDEFYLIAMCKDDRYFNQVFANRLLSKLGAFPLKLRYVRLIIDGVNRGVYMMLDHTTDALRDDRVAVSAVVRRRFEPDGLPEDIKHPDGKAAQEIARSRYRELADLGRYGAPETLAEKLAAKMDLDTYLRWLAFNTFMKNGDYVDEAIFYASPEAGGQWYFRHVGWDPDDLFSDCHHYGKYALDDGWGLLYCAEAHLDHAVVRSPAVMARYVTELETLLKVALPDKALDDTMAEVQAELFAILDDDATAAAMTALVQANPAAKSAAGARKDIAAKMAAMLAKAKARRGELVSAIEKWRARGG